MRYQLRPHHTLLSLVTLSLCLIAGCSSGAGDAPETAMVTGTVTLDDKPLEGATVRFIPNDSKAGNGSSGTTNAEGKYELAHANNKGAIPGAYKVIIEHYTQPDGSPLPVTEAMDVQQLKMQNKAKQSLPPKYSDFQTTELNENVEAGKTNVFDFPLKSS